MRLLLTDRIRMKINREYGADEHPSIRNTRAMHVICDVIDILIAHAPEHAKHEIANLLGDHE